MHSYLSVAPRTFLLILCMAFSSWLTQNSPFSDKDNVFPTELFLQLIYQLNLDFSGKTSVEEQEQRL